MPFDPALAQLLLSCFEHLTWHDRLMLTRIDVPLMSYLTDIEPVLQHRIERAARDPGSAISPAMARGPRLSPDVVQLQLSGQGWYRAEVEIAREHATHHLCFGFIHDQLALDHIIAERGWAAHPHP